ncbi:NPCBM/NEW2 domain-containing protein [Robinsoniella sp. KNHs210]|uniref:NPCBM/NEW2 domain-containing protein n=1 Tax=Robinsoniella sp. KNHs210 TaxID=1469950 RepID=UPI0018CC7630|nr:NPCBM/NEW2 domain-containing protein [Robinsoniella sp. KNHs210]
MKRFKRISTMALAVTMAVSAVAPQVSLAAPPSVEVQAEGGYEERLTPLMGWSSWNEFANNISEDLFISQMDLMEEYGLIDAGYEYFNIDDGYQGGRDKETGLVTHNKEKFPNGMKVIADYAHKLGMKAGIYTDIGGDTCASGANGEGDKDHHNKPGTGFGLGVGLLDHEEEDLRQYFIDWDYDFIKVDWCGGRNLGWNKFTTGSDHYIMVGDLIEELRQEKKKDIIYNVCCWEFPGEPVANSQADSWRTGGDLWANWNSVLKAIDNVKSKAQYSKPGKSNDLDMMQVGRGLTYEEDKSHFSMWCMAGAPLMIGADLRMVTEETLSILKNEEMIAVDQDPACVGGTVVKTLNNFNDGDSNTIEIWKKDLGEVDSATKAIAVFNRANVAREVTVSWKELGFFGDVVVRDLWQHKYLNVDDTYTITVPAHGTVVWKVQGEEPAIGDNDDLEQKPNVTSFEVEVNNKETSMDLSNLGNADWIYYGKSNDVTFRSKADAKEELKYSGDMPSTVNSTDYYNDAYTAYSWSDGAPQISGSGVKGGLTIGKAIGAFGQFDAPSDSRDHVLYVPVTGWRSNIKIEVLVNGEVQDSYTQTVNESPGAGNQPRVNKLVKVNYSTDIPATVSVRWTIVGQSQSNGNTAVEGAALYINPDQEVSTKVYTAVNDVLADEVDLAAEGVMDYVQFGGTDGAILMEKEGVNQLPMYTTGNDAVVNTADSDITYKAGGATSNRGAVQTALNSRFTVALPAVSEMTQAKIYVGVMDAEVAFSALGHSDKAMGMSGRNNKVYSVYYKSAVPINVNVKLAATLGSNPQMRLDAVTLAKCANTIVLTPTVTQRDNTVSISTRIIRQGNSAAAKTMEVKIYDDKNILKDTKNVDVSDTADTTANTDVELTTGFIGRAEIRILDASNNTLSDTFQYYLPLAGRADSGFIGRYTAEKLVSEGAILVDVRPADEDPETRIEGSLNIPLSKILEQAESILTAADATKSTNIIVYCRTGKRSSQARELLQYMGYANVFDMGGYETWTTDPIITFTNYQEVILNTTKQYITMSGAELDNVEMKYSIGEDSTITDAKIYDGPFTLSRSERVKAYVEFEGKEVYQTYNDYLVYVNEIPDVESMDGKYCSDLTPKSYDVAWSNVHNDKSADNKTMKIGGRTFNKGISAHAPSTVTYSIPTGMNRFVAAAGCDDEVGDKTNAFTILYSIYVDGEQMDRTVRMTSGRFYVFDIALPEGAKELQLVAKQGNSSLHSNSGMHSEWGIARFINDSSVVNKSVLNDAIASAEALEEADYTADSWAALAEALTEGKAVASDENATQQEVNDAAAAIEAAVEALVETSGTRAILEFDFSNTSTVDDVTSVVGIANGEEVTAIAENLTFETDEDSNHIAVFPVEGDDTLTGINYTPGDNDPMKSLKAGNGATISMWIKTSQDTFNSTLFAYGSRQNAGAGDLGASLQIIGRNNKSGDTVFYRNAAGSTGGHKVAGVGSPYEKDTWQLVTFVENENGTGTLYIDGVERGTCGSSDKTLLGFAKDGNTPDQYYFGFLPYEIDGDTHFVGAMDNITVYDKAFTAEQVKSLYDERFKGSVDEEAADAVMKAIEAIDEEITEEKEAEITAARDSYQQLTDAQKQLVKPEILKKLTDAEVRLEDLKIEKASLNETIATAEALEEADYTVESWSALAAALKDAKEVAGDKKVTLQEVEDAAAAIAEALDTLVAAEPEVVVDRKALKDAIAQANAISAEALKQYTDESVRTFKNALAAAAGLSEKASQKEVDAAAAALQAAMKGLVKKPVTLPVVQKEISKLTIGSIKAQTHTGSSLKPIISIKDGSKVLKQDVDYTVYYKNNKNPGTAQIIITGKGSYKGSLTKTFVILAKKGRTYTVGNYKYKVLSASTKSGTVCLTKPVKNTLKTVKVPDTVKIGNYRYKVTEIGKSAFKRNNKLKTVKIGKNVKKIGTAAFYNDKALKTITVYSKVIKSVGKNALKGIHARAVIKVPKSKLKSYQSRFAKKGQKSTVVIKK